MNLQQLNWLIHEGRHLLDQQHPTATRLSSWQVVLLDEQGRLRHRSRDRFPDPSRWLWTDRSLQQASDWSCATYKASLFPRGSFAVDACCGAGSDLVALAESREVVAIDNDLSMLQLARSNAQAHGLKVDLVQGELPGCLGDLSRVYLHLDPDRRQGNERHTRTTHGEAFSPALSDCVELGNRSRACVIKLAPATRVEPLAGWSHAWLGSGRSCPQQLLARGELTVAFEPGSVSAVLLGSTEPQIFTGSPQSGCDTEEKANNFIYDLHPVLFASGLSAAFASAQNLFALSHPGNYFTHGELIDSPWCQAYRVQAEMSWDDRRVRKWLRQNKAGLVEVKTRHVSLNANELQVRLSNGEDPAGARFTLLLYQAGKSVRVVIAQRL